MSDKGIRRQLKVALRNVAKEIIANAQGSRVAGGLSGEGYAGGYQQALYDVQLALSGVPFAFDSRYWPCTPPTEDK